MNEIGESVIIVHWHFDYPRAGIVLYKSKPHLFDNIFSDDIDDYTNKYLLTPISQARMDIESELLKITTEHLITFLDDGSHVLNKIVPDKKYRRYKELKKFVEVDNLMIKSESFMRIGEMRFIERTERFNGANFKNYEIYWNYE